MSERGISRSEFLRLVTAFTAGSVVVGAGGGYLLRSSSENRRFQDWPEGRLLREGGAELLGSDITLYRGETSLERLKTETRAYRLPPNAYFNNEEVTTVALISHTRPEFPEPEDMITYESSTVFLPLPQERLSYWNPRTQGSRRLNFGWRLSLGISPQDDDNESGVGLYGANYYWGESQIPSYYEIKLVMGDSVIENFPPALITAPQIVQVAPNRYDVVEVASIAYFKERLTTAPFLPNEGILEKDGGSNFLIASMGSIKLVNFGRRAYSVISEEVADPQRFWNMSSLDEDRGRLQLRATHNSQADIVAGVTFKKGVSLDILRQLRDQGARGIYRYFNLAMEVDSQKIVGNIGEIPVHATRFNLALNDEESYIYSAGDVEKIEFSYRREHGPHEFSA